MRRKKQHSGWKKLCVMALAFSLAFSLAACGAEESGGSAQKSGIVSEENDVNRDVAVQEDAMGITADSEEEGADAAQQANGEIDGMEVSSAESASGNGSAGDADESGSGDAAKNASADESGSAGDADGNDSDSSAKQAVSQEMLVYRGTIAIDTMKFEQSVQKFKKLLEQADGFIESENYTDDGELYDYYAMEEEDKHYSYTATIRVPSANYNAIMDGAGDLGDVRSKTSNVQNVTQQYVTYQSQIKIYEAEYQRYLKLLEKASEDQYALQIEQKLFDLQVKIAELKSNITNLETDVAYSYIDVTLTEVQKYQEEPEKTDTFLDRLIHTCKTSWNVFLFLIENILFCLIYTWYYIALVLLLLFILFKVRRKHPHSHVQQPEKEAGMTEEPADDSQAETEEMELDSANEPEEDSGEEEE